MEAPIYAHVATGSYVVPLSIALYRYKRLSREWKLLCYYFGFIFVVICLEWYLSRHSINNLWLTHITTLTDFTVFVSLYVRCEKNKVLKQGLQISLVVYLLLWTVSKIYIEPLTSFDSFTKPLSHLILCLVSGYVLIRENLQEELILYRRPIFWFSSATLLYCVGSLLIFLFGRSLAKLPTESFLVAWTVNWTMVIVSNLFYAGVFLCDQH